MAPLRVRPDLNNWSRENVQREIEALAYGCEWAPLAEFPQPLQRLRRAMLRHTGGAKVMARVLMAVPTHGVDAVPSN